MNQSEKREVLKLYTYLRMGERDIVARSLCTLIRSARTERNSEPATRFVVRSEGRSWSVRKPFTPLYPVLIACHQNLRPLIENRPREPEPMSQALRPVSPGN